MNFMSAARSAGPTAPDAPDLPDVPDIFVSYARENRAVAALLAEGLSAHGLTVWWDSDLSAGAEFAAVIEAKLLGAAAVIVLWSADSVRSSFVRDECSRAVRQNKLVPVRIEDVELPLGFGQLHTLDLLEWDGDIDDAAFQKLLQGVHQCRQRAPGGLPLPSRATHLRPRRSMLIAGIAVALAAGGAATWYVHDGQERSAREQTDLQRRIDADKAQADRYFSAGLDQQYAAVPQLEKALNDYLSAIELRPAHARAHYYLGHVYAQSGKPADALISFKLALTAIEAPLDRSQRAEAGKQVLALAVVQGEDTAVTRAAPTPERPQHATMRAKVDTAATAPAPARSMTPDSVHTRGGAAMPQASPPTPAGPVTPGSIGSGTRTRPVLVVVPKTPPRSDPPEASLAQLTNSAAGLFDDNKERRINTTTSLVLDPLALSDAVPLAVNQALQLTMLGPAALDASASSGVLNTLVLLLSALPGTLHVNRVAIAQLLDAAEPLGDYTARQARKVRELLKAAAARNPVAYIQIANEAQRPIAEALAARLRSFGYEAPGIELVGDRAPLKTEVRVQGKSDRSYARWVTKVVGELVDAQAASSSLRNAKPKTDTYEIWFDRRLCVPGERQIAGCKGA